MRSILPAAAILGWVAGCAAPPFVIDGPFERSLTEFRRIEVRPMRLELEATPTQEQEKWAQEFSAQFRSTIVHRLHRRGRLDGPEGPILILEGRLLAYQWEPQGEAYLGKIQVAVTFREETGTRIGGGKVSATGTGTTPRNAMASAQANVIASLYKFLRKSAGKPGKAVEEPSEPEIVPSE